jgi:hypothetical protein
MLNAEKVIFLDKLIWVIFWKIIVFLRNRFLKYIILHSQYYSIRDSWRSDAVCNLDTW